MNRRHFLKESVVAGTAIHLHGISSTFALNKPVDETGVVALLVDTDRVTTSIDQGIYGQFLEHINHSVEDGLFSEQIRGAGFEGEDFNTYWESFAEHGEVALANVDFQNGTKSVRLRVEGGHATIRQGRIFLDAGVKYDGSLWLKREIGSLKLTILVKTAKDEPIASLPLAVTGSEWQEVPFAFASPVRDTQAAIEITATGTGAILLDFVSMMRSDARRDGMLRPDLLQALRDLHPSFIRWPGGSFASTYEWQEGIGPYVARGYHPNVIWGGYSDYYGFGTDEFLGLCRKIGAKPLIVLAAPGTRPDQVEYAMNWVRYVNDPPSTEWGQRRAANGHPEPYDVTLFQIDNEPMNNGFTPETYAEIVNVYGRRCGRLLPGRKS